MMSLALKVVPGRLQIRGERQVAGPSWSTASHFGGSFDWVDVVLISTRLAVGVICRHEVCGYELQKGLWLSH